MYISNDANTELFYILTKKCGYSMKAAQEIICTLQAAENEEELDKYFRFIDSGGYKMVYELNDNWVIKTVDAKNDDWTTEKEQKILKYAEQNQLDDIFAKSYYIKLTEEFGENIYMYLIIQEKCFLALDDTCFTYKDFLLIGDEILEEPEILLPYFSYDYVSTDWLHSIIKHYGSGFLLNLADFLRDYKIEDLHRSNIGYRINGTPVIFDWLSP